MKRSSSAIRCTRREWSSLPAPPWEDERGVAVGTPLDGSFCPHSRGWGVGCPQQHSCTVVEGPASPSLRALLYGTPPRLGGSSPLDVRGMRSRSSHAFLFGEVVKGRGERSSFLKSLRLLFGRSCCVLLFAVPGAALRGMIIASLLLGLVENGTPERGEEMRLAPPSFSPGPPTKRELLKQARRADEIV